LPVIFVAVSREAEELNPAILDFDPAPDGVDHLASKGI
jgi:hypothetical protein